MKVLKFGGTSVGTSDSLRNVKKIVDSIDDKAIIVVSALGGLTDQLIKNAKLAEAGERQWENKIIEIKQRHFDIIEELIPSDLENLVKGKIDTLVEGLRDTYKKINEAGRLGEKSLNEIVSFGERMSSHIVAALVSNGRRYFSPDFIKTEKWFDKNIADSKKTEQLIKQAFSEMKEGEKAIVPGFISADSETGEITNLGRGGSDFTGALIAAALDAEILEIWTDVDGFMTADPRIVKDALIINHLSFTESMDLCTFGAKVIYPPTIFPVFHKNIPIKILNTFNLGAPGTLITDHPHRDDFDVKGVTALKDISLFIIETKDYKDNKELERKILDLITRNGVGLLPVTISEESTEIIFGVSGTDAEKVKKILSDLESELEINKIISAKHIESLSAIALVGKEMNNRERLHARISNSLQREGIEVLATSQRSSSMQIFIINQEKTSKALPLIHSIVF